MNFHFVFHKYGLWGRGMAPLPTPLPLNDVYTSHTHTLYNIYRNALIRMSK